MSSAQPHPSRQILLPQTLLTTLPNPQAPPAQPQLRPRQTAPPTPFKRPQISLNLLRSPYDSRRSMTIHLLQRANELPYLRIQLPTALPLQIALLVSYRQNRQPLGVVVVLQFLLQVVTQRVVEGPPVLPRTETVDVPPQPLREVPKTLSGQTFAVQPLEDQRVAVLLGVGCDQTVPEDTQQIDGICITVELLQQLPDRLLRPIPLVQRILQPQQNEFQPRLLLEEFRIPLGKGGLHLHVYAGEGMEQFVLLILLEDVVDDGHHSDGVEPPREAQEQFALLGHLEGVLQQQSALVLHVLEETVLADRLTLVQQNSSAHRALLAEFLLPSPLALLLDLLLDLLLVVALALLAGLLAPLGLAQLPALADDLHLPLHSCVLVLVPPAGQFVPVIHIVVVFLLYKLSHRKRYAKIDLSHSVAIRKIGGNCRGL